MKKGMMMSLEAGIRKVCGLGKTPMLVMGVMEKKGRGRLLGYMVLSGWLEERAIRNKAQTGHQSNSCMYLPLKATTVSAWGMMVVLKSTKNQRNIEM